MISVESLLGWTPEARGHAGEGLNESARQVARRVVADALPRLDETRRLVMALFYYEELTAEEISQALGLPAAQVKAIRMETVSMFRREIETRLGPAHGGAPRMKTLTQMTLAAGLVLASSLPREAAATTEQPRIIAHGDTLLVSLGGPRPERVTRQEIPDRLVFDFPGPPMDGFGTNPRTRSLEFENLVAFRLGQCEDDRGSHARLTLVLAHPLEYRVSWNGNSGVILLWPPRHAAAPGPVLAIRTKPSPVSGRKPLARAAQVHAPAAIAKIPVAVPRAAETPTAGSVQALLRAGKTDSAAAALESAGFHADPARRAGLFAQLAILESSRRAEPQRIERHAREALAGGEENIPLDMAMGRALDRQKRFEEACRWFRRATQIASDPDRVNADARTAYYLWADDVYRTGRPAEETLSAYAEAMQAYPTAPEVPWALYQSSKLHRRLGRAAEAVRLQNELLSRFPGDYWSAQLRAHLAPGAPAGAENRP